MGKRHMSRFVAFGMICVIEILLIQNTASGQDITKPWSTIETEHFRVHYQKEYADWAKHLTSRMESIHEMVVEFVRYSPAEKVEIIIADPLSRANGFALSLLGKPRMVLYTTPPESSSSIGTYADWAELLFTHEFVHIAHLSRPSRNPAKKFLGRIFPLGPVAQNAPKWVVEGYATMLEGILTGRGRPNGTFRPMLVRELAASGQLPPYSGLNGGKEWLGEAYPYLLGSMFTEWLVNREGDQSLIHLWRRMTARKNRSFADSFTGVYGESPDELYGKFKAETIANAMNLKAAMEKEGLNEGTVWIKQYQNLGNPSLSPDGSAMAVLMHKKDAPPRLEIWSTTELAVSEETRKKALQKMLEEDPEDVAAIESAPPERKVLHALKTRNNAPPNGPVFMSDNQVLFYRFMPDHCGDLHSDLFIWNLETEKVRRVTRLADVHSPGPFDNGNRAMAIRSRFGKTELVEVDLKNGNILSRFAPTLERIYSRPVVSPDNSKLALIVHEDGHWSLRIYDRATFEELGSIGNGREVVSCPAWNSESTCLYFTSDRSGINNIEVFDLSTGRRTGVSNVFGGAMAPVPDPSGSFIYYRKFWSKGFSIYKLDIPRAPQKMTEKNPGDFYPVLPPDDIGDPQKFDVIEISDVSDYGWGKQEVSHHINIGISPGGNGIQYGIRMGDILGRNESVLLGGIPFSHGPKGAAFRQRINRLPVEIFIQGFWIEEESGNDSGSLPGCGDLLDFRSYGVAGAIDWSTKGDGYSWSFGGEILLSRKELLDGGEDFSRNAGELSTDLHLSRSFGMLGFRQSLHGAFQAGVTDGDIWSSIEGGAKLGVEMNNKLALAVAYERAELGGDYHPSDLYQLGGWKSPLSPHLAVSNRILQPALEQGIMFGDAMERMRIELNLSALLPLSWYREALTVWDKDGKKPDPIHLMGLELKKTIRQTGLWRFPETLIRIGIAKIYDEPMKNDISGYVIFSMQP